ncbi:hypothetical protein CEXT_323801 [Caerostris extrusa]|uniref:Uncharacterized protein n=1 Tax=Caerostris extrusa TaxID=172846 RepID=A0AAV4X8I2_CAEEX|nr:hypothetical protein CEXT_323801 [Caerostris extrusa]
MLEESLMISPQVVRTKGGRREKKGTDNPRDSTMDVRPDLIVVRTFSSHRSHPFNGEVQDLRLSGRPNGTHWLDVKEGHVVDIRWSDSFEPFCESSLWSFSTYASLLEDIQNHSLSHFSFYFAV